MKKKINHIIDSIKDLDDLSNQILEDETFLSELNDSEKLNVLREANDTKKTLENKITECFEQIQEADSVEMLQEINIKRLDRKTSIQLRKIMIAIKMAKASNDPLYLRYKKAVNLRKTMKQLILNKYGGKAYSQALAEFR